jgi:hypothetical protein
MNDVEAKNSLPAQKSPLLFPVIRKINLVVVSSVLV